MGKAIITGGTGPQYDISIQYDNTHLDATIADLTSTIGRIDSTELPNTTTAVNDATSSRDAARNTYNSDLNSFNLGLITLDVLVASSTALVATQLVLSDALRDKRAVQFKRLSAQKRIDFLTANRIDTLALTDVWCADTKEDLTGIVGLIEVNGNQPDGVIVRPGLAYDAAHTPARDGQIQAAIASTSMGLYYNWALRPGAQKYTPTYRLATVTAVDTDADTIDVTLFAAISPDQAIDINQTTTLADVPVVYDVCNTAVFTANDEVVIEFIGFNWESPRCIGFKDNPKFCQYEILLHDTDATTEIKPLTDHRINSAYNNFDSLTVVYFYIHTDVGPNQKTYTYTYNSSTTAESFSSGLSYDVTKERWILADIPNAADYWIEAGLTERVHTQYPAVYLNSGKQLTGDKRSPSDTTIDLAGVLTADKWHQNNGMGITTPTVVKATFNYKAAELAYGQLVALNPCAYQFAVLPGGTSTTLTVTSIPDNNVSFNQVIPVQGTLATFNGTCLTDVLFTSPSPSPGVTHNVIESFSAHSGTLISGTSGGGYRKFRLAPENQDYDSNGVQN